MLDVENRKFGDILVFNKHCYRKGAVLVLEINL